MTAVPAPGYSFAGWTGAIQTNTPTLTFVMQPGLVLQAQTTMHEAEKLLTGLQKHWLLRAYMEKSRPLEIVPLDLTDSPKGDTP